MNLRVIESVISERDIYHSKNNNMDKPRVIPASELIINDDGSAFHIHLRPDQLRDNIILVGDPGRVDMVASYFDKIDYDVHSREFHAIAGTYKGKELMCISHGIGPDNIEIVVTELDALANVDFKTREVKPEHRTLRMVRVGTSGSLNFYADRDRVCDLDFEREFCEHVNWDPSWAAPYTVDADPGLIDEIGRDDMRRGYTIAAVGFYAPQGRMVRLKLADPELNKKIESFRYKGRPITNF